MEMFSKAEVDRLFTTTQNTPLVFATTKLGKPTSEMVWKRIGAWRTALDKGIPREQLARFFADPENSVPGKTKWAAKCVQIVNAYAPTIAPRATQTTAPTEWIGGNSNTALTQPNAKRKEESGSGKQSGTKQKSKSTAKEDKTKARRRRSRSPRGKMYAWSD
jgi:hypothetical protein